MFCRKCGKEISDESEFCYSCGSKVEIKKIQDTKTDITTSIVNTEITPELQNIQTSIYSEKRKEKKISYYLNFIKDSGYVLKYLIVWYILIIGIGIGFHNKESIMETFGNSLMFGGFLTGVFFYIYTIYLCLCYNFKEFILCLIIPFYPLYFIWKKETRNYPLILVTFINISLIIVGIIILSLVGWNKEQSKEQNQIQKQIPQQEQLSVLKNSSSYWIQYGTDMYGNVQSYNKVTNDKYRGDNIVQVWEKVVYSDTGREKENQSVRKGGFSTEGYDKLSYTVFLSEIDCKKRRQKIFSMKDYDTDGKVLHSEDEDINTVEPNSIGDDLFKKVCK